MLLELVIAESGLKKENNYIWFRSNATDDERSILIHDMMILFGKPIALYKDDRNGKGKAGISNWDYYSYEILK